MIAKIRLEMRFSILILLQLVTVHLFAQSGGKNIDSLVQEYNTAKGKVKAEIALVIAKEYTTVNPSLSAEYFQQSIGGFKEDGAFTQLANAYNALGVAYRTLKKYDSAVHYANLALKISLEQKNNSSIEFSYKQLGNDYYAKGEYHDAEKNFNSSLDYAKLLNNPILISQAYNNLGGTNLVLGNMEKAVGYFLDALKLKEANNDEKGIAMACNNIANAYRKLMKPRMALDFQLRSLKIKEKLNDKPGLALSYGNLGNIYHDLHDTVRAIRCYEKSLEMLKGSKEDLLIGSQYNSIGFIYLEKKDYANAEKYFNASLKHKQLSGNKSSLSGTYINLGTLYLDKNEPEKAETYFMKALAISQETGEKEDIAEANKGLAEVSRQRKDFEKSLKYMMDAEMTKDSIYNIASSTAIAEMQTKYETEKKEASIRLLQKENELKDIKYKKTVFMFISLFVFVAAVLIIIYTYSYLKRHKKGEQLRAEAEYKRINAIVNAQEEERKRISAELHDGLGQVLSAVKLNVSMLKDDLGQNASTLSQYNTAMLLLDQSCNEVRNMSHSMMPAILVKMGLKEALRELASAINNTGVLKVMVDDKELDNEPAEIIKIHLYRIVQELLNNILKYANATEVQIQFSKDSHGLGLMIEDNGKGFDTTILNNSNGLGWHSIQSRIALLKGQIEVDSKPTTTGTAVFISVPVVDVL